MSLAESAVDPGILANNGMLVRMLQQSLSQADGLGDTIPKLVRRTIRGNAWRHFLTVDGKEFQWKPSEFRRFLEAPRPAGCQTSASRVARLLEGTEAWLPFLDATRGEPGAAKEERRNPEGVNQHSERINCDNITLNPVDGTATIVLDPDTPRPKPRDTSPPPTGTSVSYTMRRLQRQAPELVEKVVAGELSPYAAAVKAGFHERKITVPPNPQRAARILVKHLPPADVKALIIELSRAAGFSITHD